MLLAPNPLPLPLLQLSSSSFQLYDFGIQKLVYLVRKPPQLLYGDKGFI